MPQTREHLAVLAGSGRRRRGGGHEGRPRGEPEPAAEEVAELVPGAERSCRSRRTRGDGLDELRAALDARCRAALTGRAARRRRASPPRRPLVHAAGRRHRRDRDAVVGLDRRGGQVRVLPGGSERACARCRCTTSRWSAPRRASGWRSTSSGVGWRDVAPRRRGLLGDAALEPTYLLDVAVTLEPVRARCAGGRACTSTTARARRRRGCRRSGDECSGAAAQLRRRRSCRWPAIA